MSGIEGLLAGRVLADRYLVEKVIGRGGMGAVYRALDQRLGRPVAVKVIMVPVADAEQRERLRQRFLREAQAAARLRHPHVVTVHDFGTDEALGLDYLVMELLEGDDVASRTARGGRLPAAAALAVVSQAARGLAAGHRAGMVHRDVKPGNLFLELDEHGEVQVRILDFGIAQVAFDEATLASLTVAGRGPLSPAYAAPEQLRGEARLTPAADVFSLAAVALFMLTGQRPFTGTGDEATQAAEVEAALARLTAVPEATPEVRDVLRRALAMDPAARWADASAFRHALEAARGTAVDTLAASAIAVAPLPGNAPVAVPDDATLFATPDDERTLHAGADASPPPDTPSVRPASPPASSSWAVAEPPSTAELASAGGAAAPRRTPPPLGTRRAPPPERPSRAPAVLTGLVLLAAAGGALAYLRPWEPSAPETPPAAVVVDSAALDSLAADSLRLAQRARDDSLARARREDERIRAAVDSARMADSLRREAERLATLPPDSATVTETPPGGEPPAPSGGGAFELTEVDRRPQLRNLGEVTRQLSRNYPPLLRESRTDGMVTVRFVVDPDGRPEMSTARVVSSSHPAFEEPTLRVMQRMRFTPGRRAGQNVRTWVTFPIQWRVR